MGPLSGIKVVEMAGLAPSPYCGMILADFGANVVVVDRLERDMQAISNLMSRNPLDRGKRSVRIDLKTNDWIGIIKRMIQLSDVFVDPYRPGVMEKLGLGPDAASRLNPRLIYARLTGWGQNGPYASMAGHDINYIALSGALSLFRNKGEKPLPPCNILGDFAGGGMLCTMGILLALVERSRSGKGQIIDAAMLDGAANLSTLFWGLLANRLMDLEIGTNMLDSGAPYYQTYETSDQKFVAVGAIEDKFYDELLKGLNVDPYGLPQQYDQTKWPEMKKVFTEVFKTKTRDEWVAIFDGTDACVAPVLELDEAAEHAHNSERNVFIKLGGVLQPAPAPRLSRSPGRAERLAKPKGSETQELLRELGFSSEDIRALSRKNVVE
ncbi:MAG: CoA transferase [Deltaproteobacteria bacterium]|nr:CoA transferase [Deltaproteobacteria bacterium]